MSAFNKILFTLIIITVASCSSGQDGDVFLRLRAVLEPTNFSINSPDFPLDFEYDAFYQIQPGYYEFEYVDHEGVQHPLLGELSVLEVTSNKGTDGGLFKSASDGEDIYIDLWLLSEGPVIETSNYFTIASTLND
ncbi:MAG: hypothetical protein CMD27_03875 [Flavobacteriales bacterium]|jgi:hypothetical protein|nr:hypothetical protein [Flavobacteriales bacterium]|tara:strand:+ start:1090 stop:1494 length:405 start_codon:yes stop_codon:yes gene_type:complete